MEKKETKICKKCQEEINKKAKKCPKCGAKQGFPKWIIVIAVIILIGIIASSGGNDAEEGKNNGGKKSTPKFTYNITNEYDDTFSHYIEGTVINNKDRDYSYVQIEFICYDAEENNIGTAIDNTNNLLAKQTWKFKAMGLFTDADADHCDFHEVTGW